MGKQGKVAALLRHGEENATPTRELCRVLGVGVRQLRLMVARERAEGALILSSNAGYYLPAPGKQGIQELRRFIAFGSSKAASLFAALAAARRALRELEKQMEGQMEIQEDEGPNGEKCK